VYNARVLHRQVNARGRVPLSFGFSDIGMFAPRSHKPSEPIKSNVASDMNRQGTLTLSYVSIGDEVQRQTGSRRVRRLFSQLGFLAASRQPAWLALHRPAIISLPKSTISIIPNISIHRDGTQHPQDAQTLGAIGAMNSPHGPTSGHNA
jgi:hypothetical protein